MILLWLLLTLVVGAAAATAALALEGAARALGRPTRLPWAGALVFSTVWPAWLLANSASHHPDGAASGTVGLLPILVAAGQDAITVVARHLPTLAGRSAFALLVLWLLATTGLLARVLLGMWSLERQRATWAAREVDGVLVLIAPATGPAVLGVRRPTIVLPEWALGLAPPLRQLVLRHELEHVHAHDTRLRLLSVVLTAIMPWNIALWWQADRLALAIEVDCDARVLRRDVHRERYGLLLLAIAQRQSTTILAPALSEPTSHLERRITAMQRPIPHRPVLVAAGLTVAAGLIVALACSTPTPNAPAAPLAQRQYLDTQVDKQAMAYPNNPRPEYPTSLQLAGIGGEVRVEFVIDATGNADMSSFKVIASDNDLFTASVRSALAQSRFYAAEVAGQPVRELVKQPFAFAMRHPEQP